MNEKAARIIGIIGITALVVGFGGLSVALWNDTEPEPTNQPAAQAAPTVEPEQPSPWVADPAVEPGDQPRDIQLATITVSWNRLSPAEQDSICQMGYLTGFDAVAAEFLTIGAADDTFSFTIIRDFFTDVCGM